jgi:esterase/lipase superfamily enzyme
MAASVYFATNRNPISGPVPNNFGTDFNASGEVTFGRATLQSVEDESEVGNSNVTIDALNVGEFLPTLRQAIIDGEDHLLITLHGFDYRFREAIIRAGYLGAWFRKGKPAVSSTIVAFSWPSLGSQSLDAYKKDYQSSGSSGGAFRRFLLALMPVLSAYRNADADRRVTLMAHSMGNHFLHAGLRAAVGNAPGQIAPNALAELVDQVVLAAADEDADALSSGVGLSSLVGAVKSMTVYYNNQDIPLNAFSRPTHGTGRLGIDGAPDKLSFVGRNIAFVNCSAANPKLKNGERMDPQWHQYYRLIPEVRNDLCGVMLGKAQFPHRVRRAAENYYRLNLQRP